MRSFVHLFLCGIICAGTGCSKSTTDQPVAKRRADAGRTAAPTLSTPPSTPVPPGTAVMRTTVNRPGGGTCEATIDDDCRQCLIEKGGDASLVPSCASLKGSATAGPAAGSPLARLCQEALDCVRRTKCHAHSLIDCYCGSSIDHGTCYSTKTEATGACKKEFDRALQVAPGSPGIEALNLITEAETAGGVAGIIATFENSQCVTACLPFLATACE